MHRISYGSSTMFEHVVGIMEAKLALELRRSSVPHEMERCILKDDRRTCSLLNVSKEIEFLLNSSLESIKLKDPIRSKNSAVFLRLPATILVKGAS